MDMRRYRGFLVPGLYEGIAANRDEAVERFYQGLVGAARRVMRTAKIDVTVIGAENIPAHDGAMLAGNHTGYADFILLGTGPYLHGNRLVRFMAKKEVFDMKVVGALMRGMKHVPVDRAAGAASITEAVKWLSSGGFVGIFPESTISRSFELAEFKTGAARIAHEAGVPLIVDNTLASPYLIKPIEIGRASCRERV